MEAQMMESLRVKTDAVSRVRPSVINMHHMFQTQWVEVQAIICIELGVMMQLRFDAIVNQKVAAGARKVRQDLFAETINKHNRQAVGKAKIYADEVVALQVYDSAPEEFRRMLKLIWGTDIPANTAIPLSAFSAGYWTSKKSLSARISAQANPLWHQIGTHSWEKMLEVLKRMEGKWNMKCILALANKPVKIKSFQVFKASVGCPGEEFAARGQKAPTHSNVASSFRDAGKESEIFMMASFMVHFRTDLRNILGDAGYERTLETWRSGLLDSKLLPEIQAMRPDFKLDDLGFLQQFSAKASVLPLNFAQDDETVEQTSNLIALARGLKSEQEAMKAHKAIVQRCQSQKLAAECEYQQKMKDAVQDVWTEHSLFYQFHPCRLQATQAHLQTVRAQIAGRLLIPVADLPVLHVVNLPMVGSSCSTFVTSFVDCLAVELNAIPNTSIALIIPPNQAEYGKGKLAKMHREKSVAEHREHWRQELESKQTLNVTCARALFDQESMYSDDRALSFEIWVAMAAVAEDDVAGKNIFGNSTLVKRKAIPGPVQCLQRSGMANWSKPHSFASNRDTKRDVDLECKQFFSGKSFFAELLKATLQPSRLKAQNAVLIADITMYDSELPRAVMSLNAVASSLPQLAYCGVTWFSNSKEIIVDNVKMDVEEAIKGAIMRNQYDMAKLPAALTAQSGQSASSVQSFPVLDMSQFKLTLPQPDHQLRWLQTTLDRGTECGSVVLPSSETWQGMSWSDIKAQHEKDFNPNGMVGRRRDADTCVETSLGCINLKAWQWMYVLSVFHACYQGCAWAMLS